MKICLIDETGFYKNYLSDLMSYWGLEHDENSPMALVKTPKHLELRQRDKINFGGIYVNFVKGAMAYRRKSLYKKSEAIIKAVGIKRKKYLPDIIDATAGLGRDAFILSSVGCRVRMLERNPAVAALLHDGLIRGYADPEIGFWLQKRLRLLVHASSLTSLNDINPRPQVVYLDPMFPTHKNKNSLAKKEMQILQLLVGADLDADLLLEPARKLAIKRVVVKRPFYALPLAGIKTINVITTGKYRFDIYSSYSSRIEY